MINRLQTTIVVGLVAAGCGKAKPDVPAAKPPPSMNTPVPVTPAPPVDAAPAPPAPVDAAPAPAVDPFVISERGAGPIVDFKGTPTDDQASMAQLTQLLVGTGLTVTFDVMELADEEHEEGYYSVRKGDVEVAQVMRTEPVMTVHAVSAVYATTDGIRIGDPLPAIAGKRPGLTCAVASDEPLGLLTCKSPDEPHLVFVLAADCFHGKAPAKPRPIELGKLAACKLVELVR